MLALPNCLLAELLALDEPVGLLLRDLGTKSLLDLLDDLVFQVDLHAPRQQGVEDGCLVRVKLDCVVLALPLVGWLLNVAVRIHFLLGGVHNWLQFC